MDKQESISDNKRIAKNTLFLYARMLFLILIQLYTVPIILKSLGAEDYGLYSVIGGIVTLFAFIGSSLSSGSQRFLSFAIGKNDSVELKRVFDSTLSIYVLFAIVLLLVIEPVGIWFLNNKMQVPESRIEAANWVFQFSVLSFIVNLLTIPYNSAVIAKERMSFFAYISIIDGVLKLLAVILLSLFSGDLLIIYALLISCISVLNIVIYKIYCNKYCEFCRHNKLSWDKKLGMSLLTYSGFNMIGSLAIIGRNQGTNILLNLFYGPLLNAAHSIGQQVSGVLSQLVSNVYMATRPQITKLYAKGQLENMWGLVFSSAKLTYFLLMIISIPAVLEMHEILTLWLNDVPEYTVNIARLLIVTIMVESTTNQLVGAFQAENRIKNYQLVSSSILLITLPVMYIALRIINANPLLPYYIMVAFSVMYSLSLIIVAFLDIKMDIKYFALDYVRMIIVTLVVGIVVLLLRNLLPPSFIRLVLTCLESIIISGIIIYILGLNKGERQRACSVVKSLISKIKKI